ncbi:hypothetical protein THIOSC15_2070012 [uncultured Thiomicrorhabdus sp.]
MSKNKTADDYVLEALQERAYNTYQLRNKGVFSPAGSVDRLRKAGYDIETKKVTIKDRFRITHYRVAEYHLKGGAINE